MRGSDRILFILAGLLLLLIGQTFYLLNYRRQVQQISSQLSFIMEHESRKAHSYPIEAEGDRQAGSGMQ